MKIKIYNTFPKLPVVVIIASVILFWSLLFSSLNQLSSKEKIHIFIAASALDSQSLEQKLLQALNEQGIKKITITYLSEDNPFFPTSFLTQGILESDLLILPNSLLLQFDLSEQFLALDDVKLLAKDIDINSFGILEQNNLTFGLEVYSFETNINHLNFDVSFTKNDPFFLLLNQESHHEIDVLYDAIQSILKH